MNIVFASANKNKVSEISQLMPSGIHMLGLEDINCWEEIPETADTIAGNALQKARYVYEKFGVNCFADDTGLEVFALNGRPGVYSARYAGPAKDANANMDKILQELGSSTDRSARFVTVIALIMDGKEQLFEGVVNGRILENKQGEKGFGYDPIFQPEGEHRSFAQMTMDEKNRLSHRALAVNKLVEYLGQLV